MGKMVEAPRYNVVSLRLSDEELSALNAAQPAGVQRSVFVRGLLVAGLESAAVNGLEGRA